MFHVHIFDFELGLDVHVLEDLGSVIFLATFSPNLANFFLNRLVTLCTTKTNIT